MSENITNSRQIVKELIDQTKNGEINWKANQSSTDYKAIFKYFKKVTETKNLIFILTGRKERYKSDLTILFGADGSETLVAILTIKSQPLIYQLVDLMMKKFDDGELQYLKEMFGGENDIQSKERKERSEKLKNVKLINLLIQHTNDGKLNWEDTYNDVNDSVFLSFFPLTKLKKLSFSARTSVESQDQDENVLRVILKKNKINGTPDSTTVIRVIRLIGHPQLLELFKLLNKRYLQREFRSPYGEPEKKKSISVTAHNVKEYRNYTLREIKEFIRELSRNVRGWEERSQDIYKIYQECEKADTIDEINKLMFKAYQITLENEIR
jgi:uncharacterized protein YecE (DUF72 family)